MCSLISRYFNVDDKKLILFQLTSPERCAATNSKIAFQRHFDTGQISTVKLRFRFTTKILTLTCVIPNVCFSSHRRDTTVSLET